MGLIVQAGNQYTCDFLTDSCTDFIIRFKPPLVTFFQTPAIKSTEGNFYIKILGQNFGTNRQCSSVHRA